MTLLASCLDRYFPSSTVASARVLFPPVHVEISRHLPSPQSEAVHQLRSTETRDRSPFTPRLAKCLEKHVAGWIMRLAGEQTGLQQYGAVSGSSTVHSLWWIWFTNGGRPWTLVEEYYVYCCWTFPIPLTVLITGYCWAKWRGWVSPASSLNGLQLSCVTESRELRSVKRCPVGLV